MSPRLRSLAGSALLVAFFALWFVAFRPVSLGGSMTWVLVRGDSMLPSYDTGDVVLVRSASDYRIGDSVAYRVPSGEFGEGHVIIHRLVGGDAQAGFQVRGDNNDSIDPWLPTAADIVGREWLVIPGLGMVISFVIQPAVAGALASSLLVAWIVAHPGKPKSGADPAAGAAPTGGRRRRPGWFPGAIARRGRAAMPDPRATGDP